MKGSPVLDRGRAWEEKGVFPLGERTLLAAEPLILIRFQDDTKYAIL